MPAPFHDNASSTMFTTMSDKHEHNLIHHSQHEPFVDAETVARFLSLSRTEVLRPTRSGRIRGYAYKGYLRHVYRYRLNEVAEDFTPKTLRRSFTSLQVQSPEQPLCASY